MPRKLEASTGRTAAVADVMTVANPLWPTRVGSARPSAPRAARELP